MGATARLPCRVGGGDPPASVGWLKDGSALVGAQPRAKLLENGTLQITGLRVSRHPPLGHPGAGAAGWGGLGMGVLREVGAKGDGCSGKWVQWVVGAHVGECSGGWVQVVVGAKGGGCSG